MKQTRIGSLIEAIFNVLIGLGISFTANYFIFPLFGWQISTGQNVTLVMIYTCISIARSYTIRRWFNARLHAAAENLAGRFSE